MEGWEKRELVPPNAGEPSREWKCRWVRLSGGLDRASWTFSDALLVDGSEKGIQHFMSRTQAASKAPTYMVL